MKRKEVLFTFIKMKEGSGRSAVFLTPLMPDGRGALIGLGTVLASDPELIKPTIEATEQKLGAEILPLTQGDSERPKNNFGFSSTAWKAPWQPQGPAKNWTA